MVEGETRPWGYYVVLADEPDHKVKRVVVRPGKRLSLQRHRHRSEHWYAVAGDALATVGERRIRLSPGVAVDVPLGAVHRLENTGDADFSLIEVQTGDSFREDDIERIEDDYGR